MPNVSFVVPCYKLAHLLPDCLNSILAQTYRDFEIVVMDDCSPDETGRVVASFVDPRVRYIRNSRNLGNIENYNTGIRASKGEYIWLLSADDRLLSSRVLERYVDWFQRSPKIGYVFCPAVALLENGSEEAVPLSHYGHRDLHIPVNDHQFLDALIRNAEFNMIAPTVMIRKECYQKVALFPARFPHRGDTYLWALFAMHYDVGYLAEPMVHYRIHSASMMSVLKATNYDRIMNDDVGVLWEIMEIARQHGNARIVGSCENAVAEVYARCMCSRSATGRGYILSPDAFERSTRSFTSDEIQIGRLCTTTYRRAASYGLRSKNPGRAVEMFILAVASRFGRRLG